MQKIEKTPTEKRCPTCGRTLPADYFGLRPGGSLLLRAYCKPCSRHLQRLKYRKSKAKHRKGEVFRKADGSLWEYTAAHWRRFWSTQMLDDLRRYYNSMTNEELASLLGVPYGTLNRKVRELGLKKTDGYRANVARKHLMLARAETAIHGNPGQIKPGEHRGRATEFKKR